MYTSVCNWGQTNLVIVKNPLQVVQVRLGSVAEFGFGAQIATDLTDVSDQEVLENLEQQVDENLGFK